MKAMNVAEQKVADLRDFLLLELELGQESSKDSKFRVRFVSDDYVCKKLDLSHSHFVGILDRFKAEGFISDYRHVTVYSSVTPLVVSNDSATDIYFPLASKEAIAKNGSKVTHAEIVFKTDTREILYDGKYLMATPRFNSPSHQFFEYVYAHPNTTITTEELRKYVKPDAGPYSSPNQILTDLGFTGSFRKMFFAGATTRAVCFRNPVTKEAFDALKITPKQFTTDLQRLRKKRK